MKIVVVTFMDGKDHVGTVVLGTPWQSSKYEEFVGVAASLLAAKWNVEAVEHGDDDGIFWTGATVRGGLAVTLVETDVMPYPINMNFVRSEGAVQHEPGKCPCCGLGTLGTCHVCHGTAEPLHADGVCWSCRDPFSGPGAA